MLRRIAPHVNDNPVFDLDTRRLRRGSTIQSLTPWTLKWFIISTSIVTSLWLLKVVGDMMGGTSFYNYSILNIVMNNLVILFLVSVGLDAFLDFSAMWAAITTAQQVNRDHLALLRLTLLPEEKFINAQHALAQIRGWRMMVIVTSVRITLVLLFIGSISLVYEVRREFIDIIEDNPLEAMVFFSTLAVVLITYMVEPIWRTKAVTAFGLWLASRTPIFFAIVACGGGIGVLWLTQAIVMAIISFLVRSFGELIGNNDLVVFSFLFISALCTAFVIYWYYFMLRDMGLSGAAKRAYSDI